MPGVGDAFQSGLKGLVGNIAHATITFPTVDTDQPLNISEGGQATGRLASAAAKLKSAARVVGNVLGTGTPSIAQNVFQVQFNPSSLRFSASGGGRVPMTDYGRGGSGTITYGTMDPNITLSVTLLFDAVNNQDAFFADKFVLNTTSVARGAATAAQIKAGKSYSVQPQVEGFIGALRWPERRANVKFAWGSLCYEGFLNNVRSTYTMFSPTGNPVRAEVTLSLLVTGTEAAMNSWHAKYTQLVSEAASGKGVVTNTGLSDQMTNLLNL